MYVNLALLAAFVLIYSLTSQGLERTPISGAVVFTALGLAFGPMGAGLLNLNVNAEGMKLIAELTLAVVLFTDAAKVNFRVLKKFVALPMRLLLLGLPLTILLGFGLGVWVLDGLTLLETAILATMLAPTDAALGEAVVADEAVPRRMRESLNVESGLNDGICVPILFVFIALATGEAVQAQPLLLALKLVASEIGIGVVAGLGLTVLGTSLLKIADKRHWMTADWRQLPVVAIAIVCFSVAQICGGSGFIAAFTGGLLSGWMEGRHKNSLLLSAEAAGDILSLITWVIFGAGVIGQSIGAFRWQDLMYAVLSLTVIRMVPVFIALSDTGLRTDEKLFMGWFGPRGLASIVFTVIVINEHLPGGESITMTVICTVILSVIAHGVSANPLVTRLADRLERTRTGS
jgi:NhaP-type Na+/H+ or K+/H+ antiporter